MTLVMHAAAAGSAAGFQEVVKAVDSFLSEEEVNAGGRRGVGWARGMDQGVGHGW